MNKIKLIKIRKPHLVTVDTGVRLCSEIDYDGESRTLWFEVSAEYAKYLCFERSDGFLITLLYTAMNEHCDIVCEAPVGEELLYQIRTYLVPSVVKHGIGLHAPKIMCEIDPKPLNANPEAVGTGISCGVDSLHVVMNQLHSEYHNLNLTHLAIYNVGAFDDWKVGNEQFEWQQKKARQFCEEQGLKLVAVNSNMRLAFPRNHLFANTYSNVCTIYVLQKLWRVYYLASVGVDFSSFNLISNQNQDSAHYDLLSLSCFSTPSLRIYSEGGARTRFEKTKALIDYEPSYRYLHVCCSDEGPNCNVCVKCRRTLVILDALDVLDRYAKVFDIGYYRSHRKEYYQWLVDQVFIPGGDDMIHEAYALLKKRIPLMCFVWTFVRLAKYKINSSVKLVWQIAKKNLRRFRAGYLFYRRYVKKYPNWRDI